MRIASCDFWNGPETKSLVAVVCLRCSASVRIFATQYAYYLLNIRNYSILGSDTCMLASLLRASLLKLMQRPQNFSFFGSRLPRRNMLAYVCVCVFRPSYASCLNFHKHTKCIWESNGIKVICWDDCYCIFLPFTTWIVVHELRFAFRIGHIQW